MAHRRRPALLAVVVIAVVAACSGSGDFNGGQPGGPRQTIAMPGPQGSDLVPAPPPAGGFPAQPGGAGGGGGAAGGIPDWVRPGVRISWYAAAASVAQSRYAWVEDPNGPWEVPTTGKRYRRTDENGGEGQPGASGDGISQIDVVAVEGSDVVLTNNVYGINRGTNPPSFTWSPGPGARVLGSVVDGAWLRPGLLAQYLTQNIAGLLILRGPYDLNGTRYSAVSFVSNGGAAYTSYTYDAQTGILLSATTSSAGATSPIAAPGENPPVGNSQLTITRFLGMRQRGLPGTGAAVPPFIAQGGMLQYAGTYFWTNPVDPSSGAFQYPMQYSVTFGQGGSTWLPFQDRRVVQGLLGEQPSQASVTGSTGRFWWDPAALAAMQTGHVLDKDPITGQQLAVSAVGQGARGTVVTIDEALPGVFQRTTFDANAGVLLAYDLQLAGSGIQLHLDLQGGP